MSKLSHVQLLVLDVDGILTDGSLFVGEDDTHFKRFDIRDGMGIKLLLECGLKVAIISGHASKATLRRFSRLGVEDVHVGVEDKSAAFKAVLAKHGLEGHQAAAMGDDVMDLPMLAEAGFAATVPEGHEEVKKIVDHVTKAPGGHGAVREVIELILRGRGQLEEAFSRYRP